VLDCRLEDQSCLVTLDDYVQAVQHNLPRGPLWQLTPGRVFTGFWHAIAQGFTDASNYLCGVLDEMFPCTAQAMLERWAYLLDYPADCPAPPLTAVTLCQWARLQLSLCAGPTLRFYEQLAEFMTGSDRVVTVSEEILPSDDPLQCSATLVVHVRLSAIYPGVEAGCWEVGLGVVGPDGCRPPTLVQAQIGCCDTQIDCTPLGTIDVPEISCIFRKYLPAHVCLRVVPV